jgi:hypothetical protein
MNAMRSAILGPLLLYMVLYIYIEREREREREFNHTWENKILCIRYKRIFKIFNRMKCQIL